MITKTTAKHILRAQSEIDKALESNRVKPWEQMALIAIKVKLDKFVEDNGLKAE